MVQIIIRFIACLALGLLYVAHAHQDWEMIKKDDLASIGENVVSIRKVEIFEVLDGSTTKKETGLRGRNMVAQEVVKNHGNANLEEISGREENGLQKPLARSQHPLNNKNNIPRKTLKSMMLGTSRAETAHITNTNPNLFQDPKPATTKASMDSSSRTTPSSSVRSFGREGERQKLSRETKEIVTLMHRDYGGMNSAHRKPPINNHEPVH